MPQTANAVVPRLQQAHHADDQHHYAASHNSKRQVCSPLIHNPRILRRIKPRGLRAIARECEREEQEDNASAEGVKRGIENAREASQHQLLLRVSLKVLQENGHEQPREGGHVAARRRHNGKQQIRLAAAGV